jgi:hypothetical protein
MKVPSGTPSISWPEWEASDGSAVGMGVIGVAPNLHIIEHRERILGRDGERTIERDKIGRDGFAIDAHEAHGKARRHLAWNTGLEEADDPLLFSPARTSRILLVSDPFVPPIFTLSEGTSGTPRQVRNGVPNKVTVGGGTPRRVHSRPKAAIVRGCARKKPGSFHTLVRSSSRSYRKR